MFPRENKVFPFFRHIVIYANLFLLCLIIEAKLHTLVDKMTVWLFDYFDLYKKSRFI